MRRRLRELFRRGRAALEAARHPRFYWLKKRADGMLSPGAYKEIYTQVYRLPDQDIIEVGGAAGAGSIAIALAMKESRKSSSLVVVEKCEGGSRVKFGRREENLDRIRNNFKRFGVEDKVVLFPHEVRFDNGREVLSLVRTPEIAALVLDGDGRLDRDFFLFWPRLMPGGLIVVDDYASTATYKAITPESPQGGIKPVLCYRLLNQMTEWGLFRPFRRIGMTVFGHKPADADFSRFSLERCREIIEGVREERLATMGMSP